MIISAFQCVGKSKLCRERMDCIDLESSNFLKTNPEWVIEYCQTAIDLDRQGYIVFVSSHKAVRDYLKKFDFYDYYMIMFKESLKEYVLGKLEYRYNVTNSGKDYRSWMTAKKHFDDICKEIREDKELKTIWIEGADYSLAGIVSELEKENK